MASLTIMLSQGLRSMGRKSMQSRTTMPSLGQKITLSWEKHKQMDFAELRASCVELQA